MKPSTDGGNTTNKYINKENSGLGHFFANDGLGHYFKYALGHFSNYGLGHFIFIF